MTANTQKQSTLDVTSPFDGSLIASVNLLNAKQVEQLLQNAIKVFNKHDAWLEAHERIAILKRIATQLERDSDAFAMLIAQEGGKPLIDAKVEVARACDGIAIAIQTLSQMRGEEIPMRLTPAASQHIAHSTREPIGIVFAVSAFNHPLNLIVHQVVPAIAVGCPIIIKPASDTPLSCMRFVDIVHSAGLPEAWCQLCICERDIATHIVCDGRIHFFSFIGSAQVGWQLKSQLAPGVRCSLEHGGVAPVIVDKNVDLAKVIPSLLKGGFYHAGQVCVSVQRVYVHKTIAKKLAEQLALGAAKLKVGDATKPDTQVGPLIRRQEVDRVDKWVQEAIAGGAKLLTGGKKLSTSTYAPTVLMNPPLDAKVSTAEVFGPVVCIYAYADRLEAIAQANSLDYAFQAAVYTDNLDIAMDTVKRLDASAVMVNEHTAFRVDWMPFAGRRHSGYGVGGIGYTMYDLTQIKMAVFKEQALIINNIPSKPDL